MISFFESQQADGQSAAVDWFGGAGTSTFVAWGTFGGGTVKLQLSPDGGTTWIDVTGVSLTADGHKDLPPLGSGIKLRADLAGATGPDVNARIY